MPGILLLERTVKKTGYSRLSAWPARPAKLPSWAKGWRESHGGSARDVCHRQDCVTRWGVRL